MQYNREISLSMAGDRMNKEQQQKIINSNKRKLLDPMQKFNYNCVKFNTHNTIEHELTKAKICYKLQQAGHTYLTEIQLRTGGKPDILVMDLLNPIAYEIMQSESDISISEKEAKYHGIRIEKIKV